MFREHRLRWHRSGLGLVTARVSDTTPGDMPRVSRQLGADTIGSNHSFILPESGAAIPIDGGSGHSCVILTPRHEMGSLVLDRRAVLAFTAAVDVDAVPLLRGGMYGNMRLAVVVRFGPSGERAEARRRHK